MPQPKDITPAAWAAKMVEIWRDRLDLMGIYNTGALRQSVRQKSLNTGAQLFDVRASFEFLKYGVYVDAGTGRGYTRGNGGNIAGLARGGGMKQRRRRPWFSRSWHISTEVLKDAAARHLGTEVSATFDLITAAPAT